MNLKNAEGLLLVASVAGGVFLLWRGGSALSNAATATGHAVGNAAHNAQQNTAAGIDWVGLFLIDPLGTYKLATNTGSAQLTPGAKQEMSTINSILTPRFGPNWKQKMDSDPSIATEYTAYLYSQGYYTNKQPQNGLTP